MAIERSLPRGINVGDLLQNKISALGEGLSKGVRGTREVLLKIVDPPYPTKDGKPLTIRFFEPGEAVLMDNPKLRQLINLIKEQQKT